MAIYNERLKEMRTKTDHTLKEAANYIGVTEATMQRYESGNGIKSVPYECIEKLSTFYNCNPSYIMGWENETVKPIQNDEISQFLIENPNYKSLFNASKKVSPEDIEFVKQMIERMSESKEL